MAPKQVHKSVLVAKAKEGKRKFKEVKKDSSSTSGSLGAGGAGVFEGALAAQGALPQAKLRSVLEGVLALGGSGPDLSQMCACNVHVGTYA